MIEDDSEEPLRFGTEDRAGNSNEKMGNKGRRGRKEESEEKPVVLNIQKDEGDEEVSYDIGEQMSLVVKGKLGEIKKEVNNPTVDVFAKEVYD